MIQTPLNVYFYISPISARSLLLAILRVGFDPFLSRDKHSPSLTRDSIYLLHGLSLQLSKTHQNWLEAAFKTDDA